MSARQAITYPSFTEALLVWVKVGLLSFGGPTGQIALMHTELVDRRRWISNSRFLRALNYCMLLPGPEAQQLSIYTGWLLYGTAGGIIAGALFVLPGAFLIGLISIAYVYWGNTPVLIGVFIGLRPIVVAIVFMALWRIASRALTSVGLWLIAAGAFTAIFIFQIPFPIIIASALALGIIFSFYESDHIGVRPHIPDSSGVDQSGYLIDNSSSASTSRPLLSTTLATAILWSAIWLLPLVMCLLTFDYQSIYVQSGLFFTKTALLTFGGAYAVLPYVAQNAVDYYGWLSATQMLDGLALAETTPGPLILVLQFVGFMAGWSSTSGQGQLLVAVLLAMYTSWLTFVPGFLFIFTGAPWIEYAEQYARVSKALTAVTAAIVGVVLNLAVWFSWQVLLEAGTSVNWPALAGVVISLILLKYFSWGIFRLVSVGVLAGVLNSFYLAG